MSERTVYKFCLLTDKPVMLWLGITWFARQGRGWEYHQALCPGAREAR